MSRKKYIVTYNSSFLTLHMIVSIYTVMLKISSFTLNLLILQWCNMTLSSQTLTAVGMRYIQIIFYLTYILQRTWCVQRTRLLLQIYTGSNNVSWCWCKLVIPKGEKLSLIQDLLYRENWPSTSHWELFIIFCSHQFSS